MAESAREKELSAHQNLGSTLEKANGDGWIEDLLERVGILAPDGMDGVTGAGWTAGLGLTGISMASGVFTYVKTVGGSRTSRFHRPMPGVGSGSWGLLTGRPIRRGSVSSPACAVSGIGVRIPTNQQRGHDGLLRGSGPVESVPRSRRFRPGGSSGRQMPMILLSTRETVSIARPPKPLLQLPRHGRSAKEARTVALP
jgi:hypothetical protein